MARAVCLGEAVIDLFAEPVGSNLKQARTFTRAAGGGPANVALGLARLGKDAAMVGRVGADSFGESLVDRLREEGVDTTHFQGLEGSLTTLVLVATPRHRAHALLYSHDVHRGGVRCLKRAFGGGLSLWCWGFRHARAAPKC